MHPLLLLLACHAADPTLAVVAEPTSLHMDAATLDDDGLLLQVVVRNEGRAAASLDSATFVRVSRERLAVDLDLPRRLEPGESLILPLRVIDLTTVAPGGVQTLRLVARGGADARGGMGAPPGGGAQPEQVLEIPITVSVPPGCDDDADGYAAVACAGDDCDDAEPASHPGRTERCDGLDNDCDGEIDEDSSLDQALFYPDADGDGWGDASLPLMACAAPRGYVADPGDCDDAERRAHPGALEVCNGIDDDCDGEIDGEGAINAVIWYADADADGFGDPSTGALTCDPPPGAVTDGSDCDDTDPDVFPGTLELCNGVDDDCDGRVDENAADATWWFADVDGDGAGDPSAPTHACVAPPGAVASADDCDDADPARHPDALEVCNGLDDDCDGQVDEDGDGARSRWYRDADGDGYGDPAAMAFACGTPPGFVKDATDCDDLRADRNPGATEVCNGVDNDCDGEIDEDVVCVEVCGDGLDNDDNGLVDCEDPACFDACTETDCDDGEDNDGDGDVDCEDDDCMGPDCVLDLAVRVTGGRMSGHTTSSGTSFKCDAGFFQVSQSKAEITRRGKAWSVEGTAQALGPAGQVLDTCDWSVGVAVFAGTSQQAAGSFGPPTPDTLRLNPVERYSFTAQPGCGLTVDDLPPVLMPRKEALVAYTPQPGGFVNAGAISTGPLWYHGAGGFGPDRQISTSNTFKISYGGFNIPCEQRTFRIERSWEGGPDGSRALDPSEPFGP